MSNLFEQRTLAAKLITERLRLWGSQPAPKSDRAVDDLIRFIYDEQPNLNNSPSYSILDYLVKPDVKSVSTPQILDPIQRVTKRLMELGIKLSRPTEPSTFYTYVLGIEGMNLNWIKNADRLDEYNDLIMTIDAYSDNSIKLSPSFIGTTEAGKYYTDHPLNSQGAAHIKIDFLHKDIWQLGRHKDQDNCLIQIGNEITITRDLNRDGSRIGDSEETSGYFGINLHTADGKTESINRWSAGCTVIPSRTDKDRLVNHVKQAANTKISYILLDGSKV
jgi:hypothetical protein